MEIRKNLERDSTFYKKQLFAFFLLLSFILKTVGVTVLLGFLLFAYIFFISNSKYWHLPVFISYVDLAIMVWKMILHFSLYFALTWSSVNDRNYLRPERYKVHSILTFMGLFQAANSANKIYWMGTSTPQCSDALVQHHPITSKSGATTCQHDDTSF